MKSIRRQVGDIFGIIIGEDEWDLMFAEFDKENRLNNKNIAKILLLILKRLEEIEKD